MWNQWPSGPPPMPPASTNTQSTLIGPVQPTSVPMQSVSAPTQSDSAPPTPAAASSAVPYQSVAPTYTPAQYAAMTPEQQYAVQQHWQQWQAYEQQYAQWHAQYGEQYKREMAAMQTTPQSAPISYATPAIANPYNYPPPMISNSYQAPPVPENAPPPPPPDDTTTTRVVNAPVQLYDQPPPPPPPPQQETSYKDTNKTIAEPQSAPDTQANNPDTHQTFQSKDNQWPQQPPYSGSNIEHRCNDPISDQQFIQQNRQNYGQNNWQQHNRQQSQFNQENRQQQNQFNQQQNHSPQQQNHNAQQQNNFNQFQQNQFNQQHKNQFNQHQQNQFTPNCNNNQNSNNQNRSQQNDDQSRNNNRYGNRQNNNSFRGRNRGRNNNFDNSNGRNNYQQQQRQQFDNSGERHNRGNFTNRLDRSDNLDINMGQNVNQQDSNTWNSCNKIDKQTIHDQSTSNENRQRSGVSLDEKAFDEQFRMWEEQFEKWKKENANHPDRVMYMQYEREFEKTRIRLLERREQMRRRKMMEMKQNPQLQSETNASAVVQQHPQKVKIDILPNIREVNEEVAKGIHPEMPINITSEEANEPQKAIDSSDTKSIKSSDREQDEKHSVSETPHVLEDPCQDPKNNENLEHVNSNELNIFHNQEITDFYKSGGIPGLDLVGSKDTDTVPKPKDKVIITNVINLNFNEHSKPSKLSLKSPTRELQANLLSQNQDSKTQIMMTKLPSKNKESQKPKIPSLLDIVVEKPMLCNEEQQDLSPEEEISPVESRTSKLEMQAETCSLSASTSPAQRPSSQMSGKQKSVSNKPESILPDKAAEIAKALQDPNVMQLLSVALVQAQKSGIINPKANAQQNQFLQQLQQLQPLVQIHQERNVDTQHWDSQQSNQSVPRQNAYQNFDRSERLSTNCNQNENLFDRFNSNMARHPNSNSNVPQSGFGDDINRNFPLTNPRNPFRRGSGIEGGKRNMGNNFEIPEDSRTQLFSSTNNSLGGQINLQNQKEDFNRDFGGARGNISGRSFNDRNFNEHFGSERFDGGNSGEKNFDRDDFIEENTFSGANVSKYTPDSNLNSNLGFRSNANNFGDRGVRDNGYFRPAQVFDYQNRSRTDVLMSQTKVVDYGHKPSSLLPATALSCDKSEFVPVKTIDYGHASTNAKSKNQFQDIQPKKKRNRWNQEYDNNQILQLIQDQKQQINQFEEVGIIDNENNLKNIQDQNEIEMENLQEYPKNKWILQNPESRQRPGPPTKRGRRNRSKFDNEITKDENQKKELERDEIEENFEEISDNEGIIDAVISAPESLNVTKKSVSLFPSMQDSNKTSSIIIPSNENNNTIPIDEILFKPGRLTRPKNIVIIIRGPPGSGKSHVAKLIKDKEVEMGGQTPRLLSIDDYFMVENDYEEKCPKTGRKIPKKEILYEYEKEMETTYMQYLIKSFKKTVTDHLFDFIIVDCCNQSLRTFNEFYNAARDGNFSPFVIDLKCELGVCLEHNIHNRKEEEIKQIIENYQDCPGHYIKLDVSNLLENIVEMEDVSDLEDNFVADSEIIDLDDDEPEDETSDNNDDGLLKSKWDTDPTIENLARLDGTSKPISKRGTATLEEYLQIDGWQDPPTSNSNGKKRVRWADIEEKRAQDKMRAIGFVVGQTDWNRMMDPTSGSGALTKTKYIERLNKRR